MVPVLENLATDALHYRLIILCFYVIILYFCYTIKLKKINEQVKSDVSLCINDNGPVIMS